MFSSPDLDDWTDVILYCGSRSAMSENLVDWRQQGGPIWYCMFESTGNMIIIQQKEVYQPTYVSSFYDMSLFVHSARLLTCCSALKKVAPLTHDPWAEQHPGQVRKTPGMTWMVMASSPIRRWRRHRVILSSTFVLSLNFGDQNPDVSTCYPMFS